MSLTSMALGQLFEVIAIAHAVIAQGVAEVPDFLDEGGGVHDFLSSNRTVTGSATARSRNRPPATLCTKGA